MRHPVARDVDAAGEPDIGVGLGVGDEVCQRLRAAGMAGQAHMQADRHHLGMGPAFLVELIEIRLEILLEIHRRAESAPVEFPVIGRERVRDHQVLLAADHRPVRQVVVIGVAIEQEAALLDHQLARVHAWSIAAVPAERPLARRLGDGGDGETDMLALLLARQQRDVLPAIAVRHDVMTAPTHFLGGVAIALQGDGAGVEGAFHVLLVEDVEQPPVAGARAVLERPLARQVALGDWPAGGPARLARRVAVADRQLRALLIVDHQGDRDLRPAGPRDLGRVALVAHEITLRSGNDPRRIHHLVPSPSAG